MIRIVLLAITIVGFRITTYAQNSYGLIGARANALGYSSSCITDEWSIFNNVGGLAQVNHLSTAFSYEAVPGFEPFNRMAAAVVVPVKIGVSGLGVYKFGDDLYNEQILSGAFSNKFGLASLGLKASYIQYNAEGFGRKAVISLSFGGIAEITPQLSFGAHIINITQPKISEDGEQLPTVLLAGIAFKPVEKVFLSTEIEKDLDYNPVWKTGLEYEVSKKIIFRTGVNVNPNAGFIGFGFKPGKLQLDYAYTYQRFLSGKHQATVVYRVKAK